MDTSALKGSQHYNTRENVVTAKAGPCPHFLVFVDPPPHTNLPLGIQGASDSLAVDHASLAVDQIGLGANRVGLAVDQVGHTDAIGHAGLAEGAPAPPALPGCPSVPC